MTLPDQDEAARRMRAAFAYRDLDQKSAMEVLSISRSTFARLTGKKGAERKTIEWSDLWRVADALELPREWFSADFARLREIPLPGAPSFAPDAADAATRFAAAARQEAQQRRERPESTPVDRPGADATDADR